MLSLYTLKSARDASKYYASGDYYTANAPEQSYWFGEGASRLGLSGAVDPKIFAALLAGELPNGVLMPQRQSGQYHRPGYDLTFSAPKSVSILALIAGNAGVLQAHREAVKETLGYIEQAYAAVRNKKQKVTTLEKTGNSLYAVFEEYDSRAGDPLLHHHCVLMNMSQKADELWRAIYFDEVYRDKIVIGMEYRARLAQKLMALGYVLDFKPGGLFEIVGVPQALIVHFSKRRAQIEAWLKEHQVEGGKASVLANFETRASKKPEDLKDRQERWLQELKEINFALDTFEKLEKEAQARGPVQLPDLSVFAKQAVTWAIEHCSEKYPHFFIKTLIKEARLFALFPVSSADCLAVIEGLTQAGADQALVYVGEGILKSQVAIAQEQQLISSIQSAQAIQPILSEFVTDFVLNGKVQDPCARALKFLLRNTKPQVLLSAPSKMLLRNTFKHFNRLSEAQHLYPCFLSNRASEIDSLKQSLHSHRVFGLEGFLLSVEAKALAQNSNPSRLEQWTARLRARQAHEVWVVVSKLSLSQWARLQQAAQVLHARLILSQDSTHYSLMQPFKAAGLPVYTIEAPRTTMQALDSVQAVLRRLERLTRVGAILEVSESKARLDKAAELALNSNKAILTLTQSDRLQISEAMRTRLKEADTLRNSKTVLILEPLRLSVSQKKQVASYQPGDVLRFPLPKQGRHFGGHYEVVKSVDLNADLLHFQSGATWSPVASTGSLKRIEVFKSVPRDLAVNDRIQWTRTTRHETDKSLDRVATQKAVVIAIDEKTQDIQLRLQNGKTLLINGDFVNAHWDYGYARLLKQADCEKPESSIVVLNAPFIDAAQVEGLHQLLNQGKALKVPMQVICNDLGLLKQAVFERGFSKEKAALHEVPYLRHEALHADQALISTQILFAGLQGEYLKVRALNPEFLPKNLSQEPEAATHIDPNLNHASRILDDLCLYHAERDAVFSGSQLTREAIQCAEATLSSKEFKAAFEVAFQKGWLIRVGENALGEPLLACRHTVLMEKLCIDQMQQGQGQHKPIVALESELLQKIKEDPTLTEGQKAAILLLLTTSDRVCAVQGIAGAGKTTALKAVQEFCLSQGFEPLVLADTGNAKNRAEKVSGMVAMTVAQFLTGVETALIHPTEAQKEYGRYRLLILDESSMISTRDLFRLQKVAIALNAQLSFVGDFKQQGSLGAGLQFEDCLAYGIAKAVMKENVRLKSAKAFDAVQKAYAGDVSGTLQVLRDQIEEIPVKAEALERMVELYVDFIDKGQSPPLVITPLNADRFTVNQGVRALLKERGHLGEDILETSVLLPLDRREIQKKDIRSFGLDQVIRFNTANPRLGIEAGTYWRVHDIDAPHHRLTLQPLMKDVHQERSIYWSPKDLEKASQIELYTLEARQFAEKDLILFRRNQPALGIFNGDKGQIIGLKGHQLEVRLQNQSSVCLRLSEPHCRHFDHAYALTIYQSQGRDVPCVIAYGDGPKPVQRLGGHLKVGDVITLPKTEKGIEIVNQKGRERSILVSVLGVVGEQLMLVDGKGNRYEKSLKSEPVWDYFPPTEDRPEWEWPKTTSQQAFLVQISRGDWVHVIVPNLKDFQTLLEARSNPKRSAFSYLDAQWSKLNQSVQRLVSAIQWKHAHVEAPTVNQPRVVQARVDKKPLLENRRPPSKRTQNRFIDKEAVIGQLTADPLHYASQWLGSAKKVMGRDARWSGSLSVTIKGSEAGRWRHWSGEVGGKDLISLYAHVHNVDWKTALKTLAQDLGLSQNQKPAKRMTQETVIQAKSNPVGNLKHDTRHKAKRLYEQASAIKGTLAEKYLREFRGIEGALPKDFRFVQAIRHFQTKEYRPALIVPVWDPKHQLQAITRIFLNLDGSQYEGVYQDERGEIQKANPKLSLGPMRQAGVVVEGTDPRTLWLTEGVETALSVAKATPTQTVIASLSAGRLKNIAMHPGVEQVVICADHDGQKASSYSSVVAAAQQYLKQGLQVFIAMPPGLEGQKQDFNDVLKQSGLTRVQDILAQKQEVKSIRALNPDGLSLPQALERLRYEAVVQKTQAQIQKKDLERER